MSLGKTLHLDNCKNISISADCNGGDISRFVVSEVDRLISKKLLLDGNIKNKLRDKLINTLTSGAQGMFRWVALSLETLQQIKFRSDFERALGQLPSKLSDLYDMIHRQIDMTESYGRDTAIKTLKWLLCAQRLMSAQELIAAVTLSSESTEESTYDSDDDSSEEIQLRDSTEEDLKSWSHSDEIRKNDIIRSCRNLVAVDAQHQYFRFAHQSVREYLLAREEYTTEKQHALAAERCLDVYLTEIWPNFVNAEFLQRSAHLKRYSIFFWPVHYKYAENLKSQALERKISSFMTQGSTTSPAYLQWASELDLDNKLGFDNYILEFRHRHDEHVNEYVNYDLHRRLRSASTEPMTYLNALCAFGFSSLMKDRERSLSDCNQDIDSSDYRARLLCIASEEGHDQILEMLLRVGFDANAQFDNLSALQLASIEGHESTVKILLDHGAHVDLRNEYGTAVLLALRNGNLPVVKMLLKKGADIDHESPEEYRNLLLNAVSSDNYQIAQFLLDHGADANVQIGLHTQSALHIASEAGHESIVELLLEHGADVDARDDMDQNALHLVSLRKNGDDNSVLDQASIKIMQLLVSHEADVNARDLWGNTALHQASGHAFDSIVKILIDRGADVQARNDNGDTALHKAASTDQVSVARLLFDHGADVNSQSGERRRSALHVASENWS